MREGLSLWAGGFGLIFRSCCPSSSNAFSNSWLRSTWVSMGAWWDSGRTWVLLCASAWYPGWPEFPWTCAGVSPFEPRSARTPIVASALVIVRVFARRDVVLMADSLSGFGSEALTLSCAAHSWTCWHVACPVPVTAYHWAMPTTLSRKVTQARREPPRLRPRSLDRYHQGAA